MDNYQSFKKVQKTYIIDYFNNIHMEIERSCLILFSYLIRRISLSFSFGIKLSKGFIAFFTCNKSFVTIFHGFL